MSSTAGHVGAALSFAVVTAVCVVVGVRRMVPFADRRQSALVYGVAKSLLAGLALGLIAALVASSALGGHRQPGTPADTGGGFVFLLRVAVAALALAVVVGYLLSKLEAERSRWAHARGLGLHVPRRMVPVPFVGGVGFLLTLVGVFTVGIVVVLSLPAERRSADAGREIDQVCLVVVAVGLAATGVACVVQRRRRAVEVERVRVLNLGSLTARSEGPDDDPGTPR